MFSVYKIITCIRDGDEIFIPAYGIYNVLAMHMDDALEKTNKYLSDNQPDDPELEGKEMIDSVSSVLRIDI